MPLLANPRREGHSSLPRLRDGDLWRELGAIGALAINPTAVLEYFHDDERNATGSLVRRRRFESLADRKIMRRPDLRLNGNGVLPDRARRRSYPVSKCCAMQPFPRSSHENSAPLGPVGRAEFFVGEI